jgi:hypothetical protein
LNEKKIEETGMHIKQVIAALGVIFISWGAHASVIVRNFDFEGTGTVADRDGWSFVRPEAGTPGQANASTGEGVLQAQSRLSGADKMQFVVKNLAVAPAPAAGQTWDTIEFRLRQLEDNGSGAPGTPLATVDTTSTLLYLNDYGVAANNLSFGSLDSSAYYSSTTADANGWVTYTVDLGQYLTNNAMTLDGNMPRIRIDPLAKATTGRWGEVDYVTVTSIPEPATLGLIAGAGIGILFLRRLHL